MKFNKIDIKIPVDFCAILKLNNLFYELNLRAIIKSIKHFLESRSVSEGNCERPRLRTRETENKRLHNKTEKERAPTIDPFVYVKETKDYHYGF